MSQPISEQLMDLDPYNLTKYTSANPWSCSGGQTNVQNIQSSSSQQFQSSSSSQQYQSSSALLQDTNLQTEFELSNRIIKSVEPFELNVTEKCTVQQQTGLFLNKQEEQSFSSSVDISKYSVNVDLSPMIINKKTSRAVNYVQPIQIKYLKPPTPRATGDITIRQECDMRLPKAPPIILRSVPSEPPAPQTLVLREAPPPQPAEISSKVISICGKTLPPPPRRLIVENLGRLPSKPQPIVIEKWLPYEQQTRNVKFIAAEQVIIVFD